MILNCTLSRHDCFALHSFQLPWLYSKVFLGFSFVKETLRSMLYCVSLCLWRLRESSRCGTVNRAVANGTPLMSSLSVSTIYLNDLQHCIAPKRKSNYKHYKNRKVKNISDLIAEEIQHRPSVKWEDRRVSIASLQKSVIKSSTILTCLRLLPVAVITAVWPDWAIFESSWQQNFLQKKPKWFAILGLFWKTSLLCKKLLWVIFGQLLNNFVASFYSNIWSLRVHIGDLLFAGVRVHEDWCPK